MLEPEGKQELQVGAGSGDRGEEDAPESGIFEFSPKSR